MASPRAVIGLSVACPWSCPWIVHGQNTDLSMVCPWLSIVGSPWAVHVLAMGKPCIVHGQPVDSPWVVHG
eukprot:7440941-Lingulodinium_polyedra.AAC.1